MNRSFADKDSKLHLHPGSSKFSYPSLRLKRAQVTSMNRTIIKNYAPRARREFIAAVTAKAGMLGITRDHIAEAKEAGDYLIVDGRPLPVKIAPHRQALLAEIERKGFDEVIEETAYTWFNT